MHLVGEVPQADGGVVARRDAEIFGRMSAQTPDSPPSVTVQQQVGRRVLLPDLDDLAVFRPHQDLTLRKTRGRGDEEDGRVMVEEEERGKKKNVEVSPCLCRPTGRTPPAARSPAGRLGIVSSPDPRASPLRPPSS